MEVSSAANLALLVLRTVTGLTLVAHGWNKFFGGGRIPGTGRWFDSIGMRPGRLNAWLAAGSETGAGVLLAIGLVTPVSAGGVIGVMVVAGWTVHRSNGFFVLKEGWEYVFVLAMAALVVATLGPGEWSLDGALGITDNLVGWLGFWLALIIGVGGAVLQLTAFWRPSHVEVSD